MDNIGLMEAFKRGEDFPDGRSQGIAIDGCNQVKVFDNTVINSISDGIGAFAGDLDHIHDIEIHHNGDGAFGWNELFYWRDDYYKNLVKGNTITNNGGNPIHYEYYDDYKTETHPKDWEYDKKSEILILKNKIE